MVDGSREPVVARVCQNRVMAETPSFFSRLLRKTQDDTGTGSLDDYDYNLRPKKAGTTIRLADSEANHDEIVRIHEIGADEIWTMISRRSQEDERTDAPMPVRLFVSGRVSGIVGVIPRGLEAPVDDALARLSESGKPPRIPVEIVRTKRGLRVDVHIGATR